MFHPAIILAAILTLLPYFAAAFFPQITAKPVRLPKPARLLLPALLCIPYALVSTSANIFEWRWLALYALLPVIIAILLDRACRADPNQLGNWRDFLVLAVIGLAVDLRWFQPAWPARLAAFNKILLLDAGIYGFLYIRQLNGVGFNLRLRPRDLGIGWREFLFYAPIAIAFGLALGFLHLHAILPSAPRSLAAFAFSFFFVAIPEELFFRGWLQNLLERRIGRAPALILTAILFGLSHFNKRAAHFNWRYVLLAAIAGVFYGRAWRDRRRVGASAITHATVDTVWGLWLR
ncbi:MAG: CPBP family glutamic-type intramembrane protease [Acidobacteriaceae bacterium]